MPARSVAISLVIAAAMAAPAAAARKVRHPRSIAQAAPAAPPIDSMTGACADVAFTRPLPCEPGGGYGVYGNGRGYPFGF